MGGCNICGRKSNNFFKVDNAMLDLSSYFSISVIQNETVKILRINLDVSSTICGNFDPRYSPVSVRYP